MSIQIISDEINVINVAHLINHKSQHADCCVYCGQPSYQRSQAARPQPRPHHCQNKVKAFARNHAAKSIRTIYRICLSSLQWNESRHVAIRIS